MFINTQLVTERVRMLPKEISHLLFIHHIYDSNLLKIGMAVNEGFKKELT